MKIVCSETVFKNWPGKKVYYRFLVNVFCIGDLSIVVFSFLEIATLFSVPLDPTITDGCDSGQPVVITHPDSSQVTLKY